MSNASERVSERKQSSFRFDKSLAIPNIAEKVFLLLVFWLMANTLYKLNGIFHLEIPSIKFLSIVEKLSCYIIFCFVTLCTKNLVKSLASLVNHG